MIEKVNHHFSNEHFLLTLNLTRRSKIINGVLVTSDCDEEAMLQALEPVIVQLREIFYEKGRENNDK